MLIEIPTDRTWNGLRLTLIDEPSAMGDRVQVCLHGEYDGPKLGTTAYLFKSDLIRAARMLEVPYETTHE